MLLWISGSWDSGRCSCWLRITFPVCLSAYPVTLLSSGGITLGGNPVHFHTAPEHLPWWKPEVCRPSPAWGEGRGSSTNNWSRRGCLLSSNGIMLLGKWYCAHFLIKDSWETVYFFNRSLNERNKTLRGVNFSASVHKLQVCPGANSARPFPAPKAHADVGQGTGPLSTSWQRTPKAQALGPWLFVNNRGMSSSNN